MAYDDTRPWRHLYGTVAWQRLRAAHLGAHPLCAFCMMREVVTEATVVDHVRPHKGNLQLFFDPANLQSLCKPCHDGTKQRIEGGRDIAILYDAAGWPV